MKVLIALTYFHPYPSGLSVYATRLAIGLRELGNEVVVLTSQYKRELSTEEDYQGIKIIRVPVGCRLSKGVLMPGLPRYVKLWTKWADIINVHLPQFESFLYPVLTNRTKKKILVTYHCDLKMQGNFLNHAAGSVMNWISKWVLNQADLVVQNSLDYAENSPFLEPILDKVKAVPIPVDLVINSPSEIKEFRKKIEPDSTVKILGLAGRVAREKGYEYLIEAFPEITEVFPGVRIAHAGTWQGVVGEMDYQSKIESLVKDLGNHWISLGYLNDTDFRSFFGICDVLVFPSLNSTESFGIVQIESMLQGTPVVSSDLPGARQPVLMTGMGRVVPAGDSHALAQAIISVLDQGKNSQTKSLTYLRQFSKENVALTYQKLMEELLA